MSLQEDLEVQLDDSASKKTLMITAMEKSKGAKGSNSKKMTYKKTETRHFLSFHPFIVKHGRLQLF